MNKLAIFFFLLFFIPTVFASDLGKAGYYQVRECSQVDSVGIYLGKDMKEEMGVQDEEDYSFNDNLDIIV